MRLREINSPGELTVDPDLIDRFTRAGYRHAREWIERTGYSGAYEIVPEMR